MTGTDEFDMRRKRLVYRASYRGTQELDILIGGYVKAHIDQFDAATMTRLEALLDVEETELQAWLMGQAPVPVDADGDLIARMRAFRLEQAGAHS